MRTSSFVRLFSLDTTLNTKLFDDSVEHVAIGTGCGGGLVYA
jgi:hypothetical protein